MDAGVRSRLNAPWEQPSQRVERIYRLPLTRQIVATAVLRGLQLVKAGQPIQSPGQVPCIW